jgi:hypothetical protein
MMNARHLVKSKMHVQSEKFGELSFRYAATDSARSAGVILSLKQLEEKVKSFLVVTTAESNSLEILRLGPQWDTTSYCC